MLHRGMMSSQRKAPSDAVSTLVSAQPQHAQIQEPKVRKDGCCASCRRQRRTQVKTSQYGNLSRELRADPFCSARCANAYYGVTWQGDKRDDRFDHRDRLKPAA